MIYTCLIRFWPRYVIWLTYLGQIISPENKTNKEVNERIASGWRKYWEIMKSRDKGMAMGRGICSKELPRPWNAKGIRRNTGGF